MIKEVTETRAVFDDEQIKTGDWVMFKRGCEPVCVGIVDVIFSTDIDVVNLYRDSRKFWYVGVMRIKAEDVASGVVKVKRIPVEMGE